MKTKILGVVAALALIATVNSAAECGNLHFRVY